MAFVVLFSAACSGPRDEALSRATADSCAVSRPDFHVATAAELELFAYDVNAPLNLRRTAESTSNGVEISHISFDSPAGGSATGMLFDPVTRAGQRPGIVLMHGASGSARDIAPLAQALARSGAVVIAIDAPFARRGGKVMRLTTQDRAEQIQLIKDLQRAVDVLRADAHVDDARIAYVGISYGGAMGALFVGIERRIKTAILVVPHGGPVSRFTGPDASLMASVSCAARHAWLRDMAPIEPIRFIAHATIPLLLQNGRFDGLIPATDARALHAAAPEPRTIRWYFAGHGLNRSALIDRHAWLVEQIGLDPR